jgi:N-acetylglucosamine kinase-like BadF-type ATPase
LEALRENLQILLDQTFRNVPHHIEYISACFGLAGAASAGNKDRIRNILVSLAPVPSAPPILTSDAHIGLVGALDNRPGLMLIAGTGSICLGRDAEGCIHRTGGWGAAYDDLGGGYWIGRQAVQANFQEFDGRRQLGPWQRNVLPRLRCSSMEELLGKIKTGEITNSHVAALAPMVVELAQAGVIEADEIISHAILALSRLVTVTHRKTKLTTAPLVLVGGLLENSVFFRNRLVAALQIQGPKITLQQGLAPAVVGAVMLASQQLKDGPTLELEKVIAAEHFG